MIKDVDSHQWNALLDSDYPFLQHQFLAALENSGSVTEQAGWLPAHCLIEASGTLAAAAPCYIKTHSWGEYVFDQQWANAYHQNGLAYYPKLLCSVPFTPSTGPRLLGDVDALADAFQQRCVDEDLSGAHLLFLQAPDAARLEANGWHIRNDVQFHWKNQQYDTFECFLGELSSSKRKKIKRERRRIVEQGVTFEKLSGKQIDDALWSELYQLYANTYLVRGQQPYLSIEFFKQISATLPKALLVFVARYDGRAVATAICFRDCNTLYGRHWGAEAAYHSLHFETCYYQGIEYCIEHQLERFDAGAQGQHKMSRGFTPVKTYSAHWLKEPQFNQAIARFVSQESPAVDEYAEQLAEHSPFKSQESLK